ncbi:hypothetical protein [Myxococcus sp. CA040A]|uniref:hypothetical protein n=1 Tax=Myxococcus sp. CA040A TaxID=2741738 RepID=UPI00157B808D|nr:hypothetical protein [Myxococcus sp. CA040A]NTX06841.1 hypothetical protein [Myxococcus sp. CA040A]
MNPDAGVERTGLHWTLQPAKSAALAVTFAAASALLAPWVTPMPALPPAVGALCGVIVGTLQARSLRAAPDAIRAAKTAIEVRRAMVATVAGKWAIRAHWVTTVVLLTLAMMMMGIGTFVAFVVGSLAYMAVRDLTTLPELLRLSSAPSSPAGEPR